MAFDIYKNSTEMGQFMILVILTPFSIALIVLRFWAVRRSMRNVSAEDWLAVLALLFLVSCNIAAIIAVTIINGRELDVMVEESIVDYEHMRRCDISALYFYYAHSLFVKLSVLVFYRRVFGVSRLNKFWMYVIGAAQTVLFVGFCIFQGFQCIPFARYFNITVPGRCTEEWLIVLTFESPNSFLDYAVVILAIFIIQPLHLSSTVKWKLRFLFGLGFLTGTLGFIKIAITYSKSELYALNMVSLWTSVQMFVSLLCCCLPMYNVFLPGLVAFWNRLGSRMVSYATLGRVPRLNSATKSTTDSSRRSGYGNHGQDWVHLGDDNSSKGFAWAEAGPFAEAHALDELLPRRGRASPEVLGIHVHRQFDVT